MSTLKKYLFGFVVATYLLSVVGIPVYLHYCGGQLEEVSYVTKSDSCCGGEEDDTKDNGCCENENLVLQNDIDFTIKQFHNYDFVKSFCELFFVQIYFLTPIIQTVESENHFFVESPPPKVQNSLIISTSVIRI